MTKRYSVKARQLMMSAGNLAGFCNQFPIFYRLLVQCDRLSEGIPEKDCCRDCNWRLGNVSESQYLVSQYILLH